MIQLIQTVQQNSVAELSSFVLLESSLWCPSLHMPPVHVPVADCCFPGNFVKQSCLWDTARWLNGGAAVKCEVVEPSPFYRIPSQSPAVSSPTSWAQQTLLRNRRGFRIVICLSATS